MVWRGEAFVPPASRNVAKNVPANPIGAAKATAVLNDGAEPLDAVDAASTGTTVLTLTDGVVSCGWRNARARTALDEPLVSGALTNIAPPSALPTVATPTTAPPPEVMLICNWPGSTAGPLSAATTLSKCLMPYAGTSTVVV